MMTTIAEFYDIRGKQCFPGPQDTIYERTAIYALLRCRGHVLLSWQDYAPGMAEFPGGGIDPGEELRAALARELREETELTLPMGEPIRTYSHVLGFYHEDEDPHRYYACTRIYWVMDYPGPLPDPVTVTWTGPEGNRLQWVPMAHLPSLSFIHSHGLALKELLEPSIEIGGV